MALVGLAVVLLVVQPWRVAVSVAAARAAASAGGAAQGASLLDASG